MGWSLTQVSTRGWFYVKRTFSFCFRQLILLSSNSKSTFQHISLKWTSDCSLRGTNVSVLRKPKTMTYGLNSVSYATTRYWNSLPDSFRRITSLNEFRHSLFTHTVALQMRRLLFNTTSLCILDRKVPNNVNNIVQPILTANSLQQQPPFYNIY